MKLVSWLCFVGYMLCMAYLNDTYKEPLIYLVTLLIGAFMFGCCRSM